jgi:MerR family transcriptional regulator, mercuric resistance operon regulatory protein
MKATSIAGLALDGGVGVETIRYYQRRGLIGTPERPSGAGLAGGFRRYGDEDRRRLRFIRAAQRAGFTLAQIGELLSLDGTMDRARARALADEQLEKLDSRIADLIVTREALRRLADRCSADGPGPCPIINAFEHPEAGRHTGREG